MENTSKLISLGELALDKGQVQEHALKMLVKQRSLALIQNYPGPLNHSHYNLIIKESAFAKSFEICEYALQKGGDPNAYYYTAIKTSISQNNWKIFQLLLQYGANIHAALAEASLCGNVRAVQYLVENTVANPMTGGGQAWITTGKTGNEVIFKLLQSQNHRLASLPTNETGSQTFEAPSWCSKKTDHDIRVAAAENAAACNNETILEVLIDDLLKRKISLAPVIYSAAKNKKLQKLKQLIDKTSGYHGYTTQHPLSVAVEKGYAEIAQLLIETRHYNPEALELAIRHGLSKVDTEILGLLFKIEGTISMAENLMSDSLVKIKKSPEKIAKINHVILKHHRQAHVDVHSAAHKEMPRTKPHRI